MSPDIAPAVFTPDTGAADKLVVSALIPIGRPSIGSQYHCRYSRRLIDRFTFVQLLYPLLTDFIHQQADAFSLLTHAVQYQPLEREAPQGGLESLPVKRIRETITPRRDPLISFKVMMNQFQRTFFLINRKFSIFESALIHRRTHSPVPNMVYKKLGGKWHI